MNADAIAKFSEGLRGPAIGREHPEYDEARKPSADEYRATPTH
jgi:hypothetical protein